MDFWENLENIATNIYNQISGFKEENRDSFNNKSIKTSIDKKENEDSSESSTINFDILKTEMMVNKEIDNYINNNSIDFLISKYIPRSLSEKFKQNSEQYKFYSSLKDKYYLIKREEGFIDYLMKIDDKINYFLKNFLTTKENEKKIAYELFDNYSRANDERGVEIAEQCLKLSNYIDTEKKFAEIYYFLGKQYYLRKNNYRKAIEYYVKAMEYSEPNSFFYEDSKLHIARIYNHLGENKKAFETLNEFNGYEISFPPGLDEKIAKRMNQLNKEKLDNEVDELKQQILSDISKYGDIEQKVKSCNNSTSETEVNDRFLEDMKYQFKNCVGKYPEKTLIEAYKHYLKAESLCNGNTHLQAVDEFKKVKEILPEQTKEMNSRMRMLIHDNTVSEDNKEYFYNFKIQILKEDMKMALKTNNRGDLCNIYNEMAITYGNLNNTDKEIEYFKKATDIAGVDSIYGTNLANCYERLGNYTQAINIYTYISIKNPSFADRFNINIDAEISRLKDLQQGKKVGKNEDKKQIAAEHSLKGDKYFNKKEYEKAYSEYNAASETDKDEIVYLIKLLMQKEIYDCKYLIDGIVFEIEAISRALDICEKKGMFNCLPFLYTLCGDYCIYEGSGLKSAEIFYELAVDLLNKVPITEKFASPYYKLARLKEQGKKYQEALTLYQFSNAVDKAYNVEKDIQRIKTLYEDDGISISKKINEMIKEMESSLKFSSYFKVIQMGKTALDYAPDNVKIYYLVCKAFELSRNNLDKKLIYEFKWFAKEGLRANKIEYCKIDDEERTDDYFNWFLGLCCELENKKKQAQSYYECIIDEECFKHTELERKAREARMFLYRK